MTVLIEPFPPWMRDPNRFSSSETQVPAFVPPADVLVTDDGATVYMDIPGVAPADIEVELDNDTLTIRGERPYPYAGENGAAVRRTERGFGRFERSLRVPRSLDPGAIEATMTDGVLMLRLPKPESLKPQRIPIQAGEQREVESTTAA
jgi:HSP20 family protein